MRHNISLCHPGQELTLRTMNDDGISVAAANTKLRVTQTDRASQPPSSTVGTLTPLILTALSRPASKSRSVIQPAVAVNPIARYSICTRCRGPK